MGTLYTMPYRYFTQLATGVEVTPFTVRYSDIGREVLVDTSGRAIPIMLAPGPTSAADQVLRYVARARTDHFILWTEEPISTKPISADPFAGKLPDGWKQIGKSEEWNVHDHWTWRRMYVMRRWEFAKQPATTQPASK
ncbi:MAG: hypothetical protein QM770_00525 [Tepidisphaeraceae bacterium]